MQFLLDRVAAFEHKKPTMITMHPFIRWRYTERYTRGGAAGWAADKADKVI
jgi:hypothetical protein